jgi:hypothetical protein
MQRRTFLKGGLAATAARAADQASAGRIDLRHATVVVRPGKLPEAERTAAPMLVDEIAKRCGVRLPVSTSWPSGGAAIAITSQPQVPEWRRQLPGLAETRAEGYRLVAEHRAGAPVVWVAGADARGALFGAGHLLRVLDWSRGAVSLNGAIDIATAPAYSIRGHQLGYRAQANSYDAWDPAQFEQYIRELTWFGVNSIEGIPFQDERPTPVLKFSRRDEQGHRRDLPSIWPGLLAVAAGRVRSP